MLNHFVHPTSVSAGQPVEGVQPIQGYTPYNQLTKLIPAFKLPEDGGKPEDEDKKPAHIEIDEIREDDDLIPEIFRLAVNVDFREMINYFLTPYHDQILDIRSQFRQERGVSELTLITPSSKDPQNIEELREQLYEVQVQLFQTPKGVHCHIIL